MTELNTFSTTKMAKLVLFRTTMGRALKRTGRKLEESLPMSLRRALRRVTGRVPPGGVDFGDLRRLSPIDERFGYGRGRPVDRYYIEGFLARRSDDIRGHVLEIGDNHYTRLFGGDRVTRSSVLHVNEGNPRATYVGDLTTANHIPSDTFDCIILTQTLHLIYDFDAALATLRRILKPGGVLLATVPGISQIDRGEWGDTWYWSFTGASVRRMFADAFGSGSEAEVKIHGNVLTAISFLQGLAAEELRPEEFDAYDPAYPVLITVRIAKSTVGSSQ